MWKTRVLYLAMFCISCIWHGCDVTPPILSPIDTLYIVTTTPMITDAVKNVVGDCAIVDGLMGPGVDPHLYKITAKDARKLANAHLIFYNGLHLEGKMTDVFTRMGQNKPVYAVSADIPINRLRKVLGEEEIWDPHIWFDVLLWQLVVQKIEKTVCELDTKHAHQYHQNSLEYQKKLTELHAWAIKEILNIPTSQRILVTAHDAFGYFGDAYNIQVTGLQGISTSGEYGVKDVERISDMLVSQKIPAIFVEASVSSKAVDAVIYACKSRNHVVQSGGTLFSDSMGIIEEKTGTYIDMFRYNVNIIVQALSEQTTSK